MDKHQRIMLARTAGRQDFNIHLLMHPLLTRLTDIRTADIEIPAAGNCRLVVARDRFGGAIRRAGGTIKGAQRKQTGGDHGSVQHHSPF